MTQLAIKGHATRGKEVIEILEMFGGKNNTRCYGVFENRIYIIDKKTDEIIDVSRIFSDEYNLFTLEEFLEKFPYKVGEKVQDLKSGEVFTIGRLFWDEKDCTVYYLNPDIIQYYSAEELNKYNEPYKEKTMEEKPVNHVYDVDVISFDIAQKDIYELDLKDKFHVILRKGKYYVERIKPKYPKTYEECCEIKHCDRDFYVDTHLYSDQLGLLYKLLICRDAYWKIAGEQMGLGKPWKPDLENKDLYCLYNCCGQIIKSMTLAAFNKILIFPTEKMRDTFYENFQDLIESCKELL